MEEGKGAREGGREGREGSKKENGELVRNAMEEASLTCGVIGFPQQCPLGCNDLFEVPPTFLLVDGKIRELQWKVSLRNMGKTLLISISLEGEEPCN